jgi:hypothetical protein
MDYPFVEHFNQTHSPPGSLIIDRAYPIQTTTLTAC